MDCQGRSVRVLVACERSGIVRDAFRAAGHDAWSCDLAPCEAAPEYHIRADALAVAATMDWDILIAHPPCTFLCSSGLHWNRRGRMVDGRPRTELTDEALEFFMAFTRTGIARYAIENPIGCVSTRWRRPDQIVQPWQFGHDASKATCLWLHNLPALTHTDVLPGGRAARRANQTASGQNRLPPGPARAMERSRTYSGIARAMADQWGAAIACT